MVYIVLSAKKRAYFCKSIAIEMGGVSQYFQEYRGQGLSGMFCRSASLSIPHLKSFAAIPSVSLEQLGHANRSVFLSHESQREIAHV